MRALVLVVLLFPLWAGAATYYVHDASRCANNGNGLAYGCAASGGAAGAFRAAAGLAGATLAAGDRVYWCGTHNINSSFQLAGTYESGSAGNPVILDGNCPVGDGTYDPGVVNAQGTQNYAFRLTTGGPDHWTLQNLTFRNTVNDCMDFNLSTATGWTVTNVIVEDCGADGIDVNAMADGGITLDDVEVWRATQNGLACNSSDGNRWDDLHVYDSGTSGADQNWDGIGINDGCGDGIVLTNLRVYRQKGSLGGGIDMQDSTGTGTALVRGAWIQDGEGSGYTTSQNAGTQTVIASAVIAIGHVHNVYLKDTGGLTAVRNFVTRDASTTELKIGDNGTSGDVLDAAISNSAFGGGECSATTTMYWRDDASATITMDNNSYCPGGVYQGQSEGLLDFAEWQTYSTEDAASAEQDPLFIGGPNPTTADDLRPAADSPLCGAGTYIPGARDYDDLPIYRDIGAFRCPGTGSPSNIRAGLTNGLYSWLLAGLGALLGGAMLIMRPRLA